MIMIQLSGNSYTFQFNVLISEGGLSPVTSLQLAVTIFLFYVNVRRSCVAFLGRLCISFCKPEFFNNSTPFKKVKT